MRKKILMALAVASAATATVLPSASATTAPVLIVPIKVTITDAAVKMSTTKAKRGWGANFVVRNVGKKPHRFEIGGLSTPVLRPGQRHILKVNLELRGKVTFSDPLNPRAPKGVFTVF